jgi:hypothetical protein
MTLTPRGRRLLQQLGQPNIQQLLNHYAPPTATKTANEKTTDR